MSRSHLIGLVATAALIAVVAVWKGPAALAAPVADSGTPSMQSAAPATHLSLPLPAMPDQQVVQLSGRVSTGSGTCSPDAVLLDCNGTVTAQLRGPSGWGYFAPYANQWVSISGQQQNCQANSTYVNVVTIQTSGSPCGPSATATPGGPPGGPPGPPGSTATPVPTSAPVVTTLVDISDAGFVPANVTVTLGATVEWSNKGNNPHTVTATGGQFNSGAINPGGKFSFVFSAVGTYPYQSSLDAGMNGSVVVLQQPAPGAGGPNLATGKVIQASSSQTGHPPEHAIDGDLSTYWASQGFSSPFARNNTQWIYVDLGNITQIGGMQVQFNGAAYARYYEVYVQDQRRCNGWCIVGRTTTGDGDETWNVVNGQYIESRYIMLYLIMPNQPVPGGYELKEWSLYGPGGVPGSATPGPGTPGAGTPTATPFNVAQGKTATALSQEVGFEAAKGTDGDLTTEWHSTASLPTWYYVDLGTSEDVDRAILRWSAGMHATNYTLYAWSGRSWYAIYQNRNGAGGDETAIFNTVRTRYVLLYAVSGATTAVGLREFEVYRRQATSGGPIPPGQPPLPPVPFGGGLPLGFGVAMPLHAAPDVMPRGATSDVMPRGGTSDALPRSEIVR